MRAISMYRSARMDPRKMCIIWTVPLPWGMRYRSFLQDLTFFMAQIYIKLGDFMMMVLKHLPLGSSQMM